MKSALLLSIAFLGATSLAVPCLAVEASDNVSKHTQDLSAYGKTLAIAYGDLDLSHATGTQIMLRRLQQAAAQVCGPKPSIDLSFTYKNCVRDTVGRAVADLNQPTVTALYSGKHPSDVMTASQPAQGTTAAIAPAAPAPAAAPAQ